MPENLREIFFDSHCIDEH